MGSLSCSAPSGPGFGDVRLAVTVAGSANASEPFLYTAPEVTDVSVLGVSVVACAADENVDIVVSGTNIGQKGLATSPDPVVYIGDSVCFQPLLLPSNQVQCKALESVVGVFPVVGTCVRR